ncbi:MAG: class I SAM-dependent methyltransferase [Pelagibacteraceae bacterium]|jgi:cyclopropane-fatty-acyl-phospholipid synthase|nr:class I SAM-dependent methyltransferase [Pelagibacteraceae bacterium]
MLLARFLNKLFKKGGFILENAYGQKYIIGQPNKIDQIEMKLQDKSLHYKLYLYPDLYFGEAYTAGSLYFVRGSLTDFLNLALENIGRTKINKFNKILNSLRGSYRFLTNFNFIKNSKVNVAHHYDVSDDLYFLFLDPLRQYSCGYFKNETDTLEQAQINKIKHIAKKLDLKPDHKVLDIGCGWGYLAIEIAKQHKCNVTGITLSENQYNFAKKKVAELNLSNQVEIKLVDYREIKEKYDRIVSVGMFEHVGRKFYNSFFDKISQLLNSKGVALLHTIGSVDAPRDPQPWITKYIFPGGYTPSLSQIAVPIEKSGLIVTDLEVLKIHYAHTLRHWKERFNLNRDKVLDMFDEQFFRMYEFYLTSCEAAFKFGDQVVYQIQLSKELDTVPSTRDYIYR